MAVAAAVLLVPVHSLEITEAGTNRLLWRVPAKDGETVDLEYTHSITGAPVTERFRVTGGGLRLVEIASTGEAALQYLAQDPPYESRGARLVSARDGPTVGELTIRIGQTGRQTLAVGGRTIPLYRAGEGEAVRLAVTRRPLALVLTKRPRPP